MGAVTIGQPANVVAEREERWNYSMLAADGAAYAVGSLMVSQDVILPSIISSLGGSDAIIALAPFLALMGFAVSPLFLAHRMSGRSKYAGFVFWGSVPQRLPPLLAGVALLFWWDMWPALAFWLVVLCPFLNGLCGGFVLTAFVELTAKLVPPHRRAGNNAWRGLLGRVLGLGAVALVSLIFQHFPGPEGYGMLFLLQFGFFVISWLCLALLREAPGERSKVPASDGWWAALASMIGNWQGLGLFRRYFAARLLGVGCMIVVPFLALHYRTELDLPESELAPLVQAETLGAILGCLIAGWSGDRFGAKLPLCISRSVFVVLALVVVFVDSYFGAIISFVLLGAALFIGLVSENVLLMEVCPADCRPMLTALQYSFQVPAMLLAAWCSRQLIHLPGGISACATASALFALASLAVLLSLPEPRRSAGC